jgi:hypothetical protein
LTYEPLAISDAETINKWIADAVAAAAYVVHVKHEPRTAGTDLGRVARRALLATIVIAAMSCGRYDSPTSPTACSDISGTYDVSYQGMCNASQYPSQWVLVEEACAVRSNVNPDNPTVSGSVSSSRVHLVMRNGFTTCMYQLQGDGQFDGTTIRATLTGSVSGPCCSGQESLTVVAVRRKT